MKTCNERECYLRASFRERLRWLIRLRANYLAVFILLSLLFVLLMVCLIFARQPKRSTVIHDITYGPQANVGGNPKARRSSPKENKYRTDFMFGAPFLTSELTFKVYFFEFKNPWRFVVQEQKPDLVEKGPYVYRVHRKREKVYDNERYDEISYREIDTYKFDQGASGSLRENDEVKVVGFPYLQVIHWLQAKPVLIHFIHKLNDSYPDLLGSEDRFSLVKKVKDLLFDGVLFCKSTTKKHFVLRMICKKLKRQVDQHGFMRRYQERVLFSVLAHRNNAYRGTITINKGVLNESKAGLVTHYNFDSVMDYWQMNEPECNRVKGFLTTFPPKSKASTVLEIFLEEICRTVKLEFAGTKVVQGIRGYKYSAISSTFTNTDENACFCTKKVQNFNGLYSCLYKGGLDATTCIGAPIVISFPHFLYADDLYTEEIDGMKSHKNSHEMYIVVEPVTGTILKIVKRFQYSMFAPHHGVFTNQKTVLIPMFWTEESYIISEHHAGSVFGETMQGWRTKEVIKYILLFLFLGILLGLVILVVYGM